MAVVIFGKTCCVICGKLLQSEDDVVSLGPFVANRRDPLHRFSDAAFHRHCVERDRLAGEAIRQSEEAKGLTGAHRRPCVVCGEGVSSPDDYFGTSFLTSDETSPLFEFNGVDLHRSHYDRWNRAAEFRRRIEEVQASDAWEGAVVRFDPLPAWRLPAIEP